MFSTVMITRVVAAITSWSVLPSVLFNDHPNMLLSAGINASGNVATTAATVITPANR
jgi:hypothetical protein